jgi:hypothetical protein
MHQHYKDILDRIGEPPTWFDEYGVPRFEDFSPRRLSNIYAKEAALAQVSCQCCGHTFKVALTDAFASGPLALSDEIRLGRVHYGDPPNVHCCPAGPSSNSVMHGILEYWLRDYEVSLDWQRDPTLEGTVGERLDPPDTFAEVVDAAREAPRSIVVTCTSRRNRYDLAGRIAAAMAADGRVLIACAFSEVGMARHMLDGLLPKAEIGNWKEVSTVTMVEFSNFKDVLLDTIDSIMVLAAPSTRNDAALQVWNDVAARLAWEVSDKIIIEFVLAHSAQMLAKPDFVFSAARSDADETTSEHSS